MATDTLGHRWRFFRAGGFDQVRLDSGADLLALEKLDQKLWVALACPTEGLEFDKKTLELIDSDSDGRIRAPELLATLAALLCYAGKRSRYGPCRETKPPRGCSSVSATRCGTLGPRWPNNGPWWPRWPRKRGDQA